MQLSPTAISTFNHQIEAGEDVLPLYHFTKDQAFLNQECLESQVRSYPRRFPFTIARGQGAYIEDTHGQVYLDCLAGAGALPLGHNNAEVNQVLTAQIESLVPFQTLDVTTPVKDAFVQSVMAFMPADFARDACIQFCGPSGSDAVEAALKIAKQVTGRDNIISFHGAYHGMTNGALALMGNLNAKSRRSSLMPGVHFFPFPYSLRCKFGVGGEAGDRASIRYIESVLHDQESGIVKPAALILEHIQGEGGVIPASAYWLQEIRRICTELEIVLIVDEIQCGIGRSGNHFAFEHAGITPDILVLSKAIGGGQPLACLVFKKDLDCWKAGEHAGTFRGNQLAMAAGAKTLEIIQRDNLTHNAAVLGNYVMGKLQALSKQHPCIAQVRGRGRGLMVGMEITAPGQTDRLGDPLTDPERAATIQRAALSRGLIIEKGGRHGGVSVFCVRAG
ncbi:Diaminobutyrate--2-oxoglutarate aminotransferase [Pseudomonas syringae pv. maculicola]|nr:Diaminobutyrate--2-oxoglutarate aminotransferase [Pseudomonas syringae pv. maculicola]